MNSAWIQFVQSQTGVDSDSPEALSRGFLAIRAGAGLINRNDRALLQLSGADRASWLHNLTTNEVKNLGVGEGNYAFVLNLKGRIMFDVNICVRPDVILLDLDQRCLSPALAHFDKYTIVEDVTITDLTESVERFALTGPKISSTLADLGVSQLAAMPDLGTTTVSFGGSEVLLVRHDFSGALGVEIITEPGQGEALWNYLVSPEREVPAVVAGSEALDVHRIESGIPVYPNEINDEVLPGETGQQERSVSYQKGCYLGQEVVERMRSRGVVARKLRGLVFEGDVMPSPGSELLDGEGHSAGRITSACRSISRVAIVGLGYVKTGSSAPGTELALDAEGKRLSVTVSDLPMVDPSAAPV